MSHNIPVDHGITAEYLRTLYALDKFGRLWHKRRPVWMFTDGKKHSAQSKRNVFNAARW